MSIEKRVIGGKPRHLVRYRDEQGKDRSRTFGTKKEASKFEADRVSARALGGFAAAEPSRILFGEWAATWQAQMSGHWEENTRRTHAERVKLYLLPTIGRLQLSELTPARLARLQEQLRKDHSANTTNEALRTLSAALGVAVGQNLLPMNPCSRVKMLPHKRRKGRPIAPLVIEQIRAELEERDAVMVSLLAYGGLRPAEARALSWGNVRAAYLDVQLAATRSRQLKSTKTDCPRQVALCRPLRDDLARFRPVNARADQLVIASHRGGNRPLSWSSFSSKILVPAMVAAGLEGHPYDFRHTFASLLLHEGRSFPYVAEQLGHSVEVLMRNYAHAFPAEEMCTRVSIDAAVAAAREKMCTPGVLANVVPLHGRLR